MGSAYHLNLLMHFLALRIGTRRLPVISFGFTHYAPKDESRGKCILVCQACVPLYPLCLPSVSLTRPLSPLLSPCSCLQLLLGLVSSSAPPLKALESNLF